MDWLNIAIEFQTAIVGVIGFTGVIAAQFVSAYLTRRREVATELRKAEAITAAVRAELEMVREAFSRPHPSEDLPEIGMVAHLHKVQRPVTRSLGADIYLVQSVSIYRVLYALATIDSAYENMGLANQSLSDTHITLSREQWPSAIRALNGCVASIDDALETLR